MNSKKQLYIQLSYPFKVFIFHLLVGLLWPSNMYIIVYLAELQVYLDGCIGRREKTLT
jgi:hypothetical protein